MGKRVRRGVVGRENTLGKQSGEIEGCVLVDCEKRYVFIDDIIVMEDLKVKERLVNRVCNRKHNFIPIFVCFPVVSFDVHYNFFSA